MWLSNSNIVIRFNIYFYFYKISNIIIIHQPYYYNILSILKILIKFQILQIHFKKQNFRQNIIVIKLHSNIIHNFIKIKNHENVSQFSPFSGLSIVIKAIEILHSSLSYLLLKFSYKNHKEKLTQFSRLFIA